MALSSVVRAVIRLRPQLADDKEITLWHLSVPTACYLGAAGVGVVIILGNRVAT